MKKTALICMLSFFFLSVCNAQQADAPQSADAVPVFGDSLQTPSDNSQKKYGNFTITAAHKNTVKPLAILVEMKPGDFYKDSILVENMNDNEISLHLYASDGIPGAENVSATRETEAQNNVGKWTRFSESEITLAPKEKKEVGFMILIPKKAQLDEYKGGISAVLKVPYTGGSVRYSLRYVMGLFVTVTDNPQHVPKVGEINIFESGTPYFWGSVALFVLGMCYFIWGSLKERKKKKQLIK